MTREEAKLILSRLINSGILDSELEGKINDIANHICANDFEDCIGTAYCAEQNCQFLKD